MVNESRMNPTLALSPWKHFTLFLLDSGPMLHAHGSQNLGCKLKATSRRGPSRSRKSLRVACWVAPCRPLGRAAAAEAPFLYKKSPHTRRSQWNKEVAKGKRGQERERERERKVEREVAEKTKERMEERGRAEEWRKRDGESREGVGWGWRSEGRR